MRPLCASPSARSVRRHEVLGAVFAAGPDGEPVQVLAGGAPFRPTFVDLTATPRGSALADRLAQREARRPFDLRRGPLLRAVLIRLGAGAHRLCLTLHHIVSDGWSLGLLLSELGALYGARRSGVDAGLAPLPAQYVDYAVWEGERLESERSRAAIDRVRERLAGALPVLEVPTDRPHRQAASSPGDVVTAALPSEAAEELVALGRGCGATPFAAFLAVFGVVLWRWSGRSDLVLGTPVAGRSALEVEPLIGFFVNTVPVRLRVDPNLSFGEHLDATRRVAEDSLADGDVPFDRLVEELAPAGETGHLPIFQHLFTVRDGSETSVELPGLESEVLATSTGTAKFDLTVVVSRRRAGTDVAVEFDRDLFDRSTALRLAALFARVLASAMRASEARLAEIQPLSPAEEHQLRLEHADSPWTYPSESGLPDLFRRQLELAPDRVAVSYGARSLSYGRLDERAAALAHRLVAAGVRPGDRVGLATARRPSLIVAMLGGAAGGGRLRGRSIRTTRSNGWSSWPGTPGWWRGSAMGWGRRSNPPRTSRASSSPSRLRQRRERRSRRPTGATRST